MASGAIAPRDGWPAVAADGAWQARLFSEWSSTREISSGWNRLASEHGDAGIFLEHGWFEQWWSAFGHDKILSVVALYRQGALAAVFPCCLVPRASGRLHLMSMTSEAPYEFLVSRAHRREALQQFVGALTRLPGVFPANFEDFTGSSENQVLFQEELRRRQIPFGLYEEPHSPYVDVRAVSWDDYLRALPSKLSNNLRKGRRRADRAGALSFEIVDRTADLDALMTDLFEVESRSWKGAVGTDMRSDPRKERFYRGVARWAMESGRLRACVLRFDGRIIAFDLCLAGGGTLFALKTGYDADRAAAYSPGNLMRFEVLKHVFSTSGFDRYDFLGRCYDWKREWTSTAGVRKTYQVFAPDWRGRLACFGRYGWKTPLRSSPVLAALASRVRARLWSR